MTTTTSRNGFHCNLASIVVAFFVLRLTESTTTGKIHMTLKTTVGADKCAPSSCGDIHNISFPFRLQHYPNHCGYYTVECDDNVTVVRRLSQKYHVKAIDYDNETFRVVDPGLNKNNCSSLPRFPFSSMYVRNLEIYSFYVPDANPVVFLKCANPVDSPLYVPTAPCISQSENTYGYVIIPIYNFSPEDLEYGCTVYSIGIITWIENWEIGNVSYKDIHNQMAEGVDVSWSSNSSGYCDGRQWITYYGCFPNGVRGVFELVRFWIGAYLVYHLKRMIIVVGGARFIFGYLFLVALLLRKWRRRHCSAYNTIEDFLHTDSLMTIRYSYFNIKKMSNGFKHKLGSGGFGSVFKCKLRSGRFGAIKLLSKSNSNGEDFMSEVATIGRIHHVNVVQLVGYCVEGSKRALVYDFMPNGSLDKYIFSNEESLITLSYTKMYEIAIGVAKGIEYLHQGCEMQILHFDIKPHNILLDENFIPKISDFGLAKLYPANNSVVSTMAARGTMGYIAPELFYKNIGVVSYKVDVYSFGMLLMEMASRRRNLNAHADRSSQLYFPSWVYDQYNEGKEFEISDDATEEEMMLTKKIIMVSLWCIQMRPSDRPSMKRVIQMLVGDVENLELPPKPSMCPQPTPVSNLQIPICSDAELTFTLSARS